MDSDFEDDETQELTYNMKQYKTIGILDGIESSKELHLQKGFDDGFSFGLESGRLQGRYLGVLRAALLEHPEHKGIQELVHVKEPLDREKVVNVLKTVNMIYVD